MAQEAYALETAGPATPSGVDAPWLLPVLRPEPLSVETLLDLWRDEATVATVVAAAQSTPPHVLELPRKPFVVRTSSAKTPPPNDLMMHFASRLWGARCGKSARRVLRGGTGTRSYAGSVRAPWRKPR